MLRIAFEDFSQDMETKSETTLGEIEDTLHQLGNAVLGLPEYGYASLDRLYSCCASIRRIWARQISTPKNTNSVGHCLHL